MIKINGYKKNAERLIFTEMIEVVYSRSGLKRDKGWSRFIFQWLALALALHIIAAVRSSGFFHNDEHFQIAEFINAKLGRSPLTELPLEFREMMRPWLIPSIFAGVTWLMNSIGITSPFEWAMSYRIFSAFIGWLSTAGLALCCYLWFPDKKWRNWAVMALTLLWYMPALHARHSSENLGGSFFFIGLALLLLGSPSKPKQNDQPGAIPLPVGLLAGFLFGIAFESRYQVVVMIFGAILWLLAIARVSILRLVPIIFGMALAVGLGTLSDYWGYGQWTFAPKNYYQYNIVQTHLSASDHSPWWDYFRRSITESWPILGFLLLISFLVAWIRNPKHVLTWSLLPFFAVHLFIHHKELRFLFPLLHAGGVLFLLSIAPFEFTLKWPKYFAFRWNPDWKSKKLKWPTRILIGLNLIALLYLSTMPAWIPIRFYQKLYAFKPYGFELYYKDDVFFNFGGAIMNFYRSPDLHLVKIDQYQEFIDSLHQKEKNLWLFSQKSQLPEEAQQLRSMCTVEFSTFPAWFDEMKFRNLFDRISNWTVFRCKSPGRLKNNLTHSET